MMRGSEKEVKLEVKLEGGARRANGWELPYTLKSKGWYLLNLKPRWKRIRLITAGVHPTSSINKQDKYFRASDPRLTMGIGV